METTYIVLYSLGAVAWTTGLVISIWYYRKKFHFLEDHWTGGVFWMFLLFNICILVALMKTGSDVIFKTT